MNFYSFFTAFAAALTGNIFVKLLALAICADMIFGSLRALKYHRWNSCVGIDGGIRKMGMVSAVLLLTAIDMLLQVDLIGWVGADAQQGLRAVGIVKLGATELFVVIFLLYECTSVLKNMLLCGIPIPAGIRRKVAVLLEKMTDETGMDLLTGKAKEPDEPPAHLDLDQLRQLPLDQLRLLADSMDVEYLETDSAITLADLIAAVELHT